MKKLILGIILGSISINSWSGAARQVGEISNITAVRSGLLVQIDTGLPDNCTGTPHGWMLIKQEHTTIISVVLAAWASGNKKGVIYTRPAVADSYCLVKQFDPEN